jgi:hypothetical protein
MVAADSERPTPSPKMAWNP